MVGLEYITVYVGWIVIIYNIVGWIVIHYSVCKLDNTSNHIMKNFGLSGRLLVKSLVNCSETLVYKCT